MEHYQWARASIDSIHNTFRIHGPIDESIAKAPYNLHALQCILQTVASGSNALDPRTISAVSEMEEDLRALNNLVAQLARTRPIMRILRSESFCQQLRGIKFHLCNSLEALRGAYPGNASPIDNLCADFRQWQLVQHPRVDEILQQLTQPDRQRSLNVMMEMMENVGLGVSQVQQDIEYGLQEPALTAQEERALRAMRSCCDAIQTTICGMWIPPHTIQLHKKVGKGGAGTVYKATAAGHGEVAVKVLEHAEEIEATEEALQEVLRSPDRSMAALRRELCVLSPAEHSFDHVCRYKGMTVQQKKPAIVMEFYCHGSLDHMIKNTNGGFGLDVTTALKYSRSILRGLEELHSARFIVLDVKPANVLLQDNGTAVLADFGLSRTMRAGITGTANTSVQGTCEYMPPEQFMPGAKISAKSDIWAFGATLVHMLSGQLPFNNLSTFQISNIVANQKQHPALPPQANYGTQLRRLLEQCFQHEPERRPTAQQALDMVKKALKEWKDGQPELNVQADNEDGGVAAGLSGLGLGGGSPGNAAEALPPNWMGRLGRGAEVCSPGSTQESGYSNGGGSTGGQSTDSSTSFYPASNGRDTRVNAYQPGYPSRGTTIHGTAMRPHAHSGAVSDVAAKATISNRLIEDDLSKLSSVLPGIVMTDHFYGDKLVNYAMDSTDQQLNDLGSRTQLWVRCLLGAKLLQFISTSCGDVKAYQPETKELFDQTAELLPVLHQVYEQYKRSAGERQRASSTVDEIFTAVKEVVKALSQMRKIILAVNKGKVQRKLEVLRCMDKAYPTIKSLLQRTEAVGGGARPPYTTRVPGATMY